MARRPPIPSLPLLASAAGVVGAALLLAWLAGGDRPAERGAGLARQSAHSVAPDVGGSSASANEGADAPDSAATESAGSRPPAGGEKASAEALRLAERADLGFPATPVDAPVELVWSGSVSAAATSEPIADARVLVEGAGREREAQTDEEGRFELTWFEEVAADLTLQHPSYVDQRRSDIALDAPGHFALAKSARLSGSIAGLDDLSIEAVHAAAELWHVRTSSSRFWERTDAPIDAHGRFVFADLEPGDYALAFSLPGASVATQAGITLRSGEQRELRLTASPAASLLGHVLERGTRSPIGGATIEFEPRDTGLPTPQDALSARSDERGEFLFESLAPGAYRYRIRTERGDLEVGKLDVPASGRQLDFEFLLRRAGRIEGLVLSESGKPLAGALVAAFAMRDGSAVRRAAEADFSDDTPKTLSASDGSFALEAVPAGRDLVLVGYPPGFELTNGESGADRPSLAPGSLVLPRLEDAAVRTGVHLRLEAAQRLLGSVVNEEGDAIPLAQVELEWAFGERFVPVRELLTDGEGAFLVQPLIAGRYRVEVAAPGFSSSRVDTEIFPGEDGEVEIVLEPRWSLRGRAVDESEAAVPQLPVRLTLIEEERARAEELGREIIRRTSTDLFGRFHFDDLYEGTWILAGSSYTWKQVHVSPQRVSVPRDAWSELVFAPRERRDRFAIRGEIASTEARALTDIRIDGLRGGLLWLDDGRFRASGLTPTRHQAEGLGRRARDEDRRADRSGAGQRARRRPRRARAECPSHGQGALRPGDAGGRCGGLARAPPGARRGAG